MSKEVQMKYDRNVENGSEEYIVVPDEGLDYRFDRNRPKHLKCGAKVIPANEMEKEYCQNLAMNGALQPV